MHDGPRSSRPSTAGRAGSSSRSSTSGRAPSGCALRAHGRQRSGILGGKRVPHASRPVPGKAFLRPGKPTPCSGCGRKRAEEESGNDPPAATAPREISERSSGRSDTTGDKPGDPRWRMLRWIPALVYAGFIGADALRGQEPGSQDPVSGSPFLLVGRDPRHRFVSKFSATVSV